MAHQFQRQLLIDAKLMTVVDKLRSMGSILHYQFMSEQPSQNGGAIFRFEHGVSFSSWGANVKHFFTPLGKEFFLYTVSTFLHCSVMRFLHR